MTRVTSEREGRDSLDGPFGRRVWDLGPGRPSLSKSLLKKNDSGRKKSVMDSGCPGPPALAEDPVGVTRSESGSSGWRSGLTRRLV